MDKPESPTVVRKRRISPGDFLLLQLPSGLVKPVPNIAPDRPIDLRKFGSFAADELLGQPYGLTYEIEQGKLLQTAPTAIHFESCNVEDIVATNEKIKESDNAQKMTGDDIKKMKRSGLSGREIIRRQTAQHAAVDLKFQLNEKEKFLKKFTCIEPTITNFTQYLFESNSTAIRGLRPNTLSQMLSLANVRPGWQGMVVDDAGGLLVAAVIERLGGSGTVLVINDAESPPDLKFLTYFNFPAAALTPLRSLNWAQLEPDWSSRETRQVRQHPEQPGQYEAPPPTASIPVSPSPPLLVGQKVSEVSPPAVAGPVTSLDVPEASVIPSLDSDLVPHQNGLSVLKTDTALIKSSANKSRKEFNHRSKKWERRQEVVETRQRFFDGNFEGLIVCSKYEPQSIIDKLRSHLAGSASLVIHSPHLCPLASAQHTLRKASDFIHVTISEPWLRRYQVLPGRTHPEMNGTPQGGFMLSAIKVIAHVEASENASLQKEVRM